MGGGGSNGITIEAPVSQPPKADTWEPGYLGAYKGNAKNQTRKEIAEDFISPERVVGRLFATWWVVSFLVGCVYAIGMGIDGNSADRFFLTSLVFAGLIGCLVLGSHLLLDWPYWSIRLRLHIKPVDAEAWSHNAELRRYAVTPRNKLWFNRLMSEAEQLDTQRRAECLAANIADIYAEHLLRAGCPDWALSPEDLLLTIRHGLPEDEEVEEAEY